MAKEIKNILISNNHDRQLEQYVSKYFSGCLIDIGCGAKSYKDLLAPHLTEHIGVDHQETLHDKLNVDRFCTAYNLPGVNEKFDCAICTAVLVEEPELALQECRRVLKPDGVAIYSVPFIWHLHEELRDSYFFQNMG